MTEITRARAAITASSVGGAPFLASFGLTIGLVGLAAFWLPTKSAALALLFQGNLALPLAFGLERRLRWAPMAADNPLRGLAIQLALSQLAALPMVLLAYTLAPWTTGVAMASVAAGHLLPYAWLHRTSTYIWLAPAVSLGTLAIAAILRESALPWTLLYMTGVYWTAAALLYRHARVLHEADLCYASRAALPPRLSVNEAEHPDTHGRRPAYHARRRHPAGLSRPEPDRRLHQG